MGHSTIAMTFDVCEHVMPGGVEEPCRKVDEYLGDDAAPGGAAH